MLSSGLRSNFLVDLKPWLLNRETGNAVGLLICEVVAGRFGGEKIGAFAGVAMGGFYAAMQAERSRDQADLLCVRAERKGHGSMSRVDGLTRLIYNHPVVLIEDVVTTGRSVAEAMDALDGIGARVDLVVSVVDRCEDRRVITDRCKYVSLIDLNQDGRIMGGVG